ncbi:MAG: hypothetical protein GY847_24010 [Proteobacteria bacterium]|nr:hypothetical protein [Pseudomonadota bacterium]
MTARFDGFQANSTIIVSSATVTQVVVEPPHAVTVVDGNVSFTATAVLSDGDTQDITETTIWVTDDSSIASVSSEGVATGVSPGETTVRANAAGQVGEATLTVTAAELLSINVTPTNPTVGVGVSISFIAMGTFDDGSIADVTYSAIWESSDASIVEINGPGSARTMAAGVAMVSASVGSIRATTAVTDAALSNIAISPSNPTIPKNNDLQFEATGEYDDGSELSITDQVTWNSASPSVALISNAWGANGLASAIGAGTSTIRANLDGIDATTTLTVTEAALVSISVLPNNKIVDLGEDHQFLAMGTFDDGSSIDLTIAVIWTVSNEDVASISNAPSSKELLTSLEGGTATVTAILGSVRGDATISVIEPELIDLTITPVQPSVPVGEIVQFFGIAVYSNNTTQVIGQNADWTSSRTSVGDFISGKDGGTVEALSPGETIIEVTYNGFSASTIMTVTNALVTHISVTPVGTTLAVGDSRYFQAVALYDNGTSENVTSQVSWISSDSSVLALNSAKGGEFVALEPGTVTITATYEGIVGTARVVVEALVIAEVQVWPVVPEVAVGMPIQFNAVVLYSNFTTMTVTNDATWFSSDSEVAGIENAGKSGTIGLTTGISPGDTTISATYEGVTGSTTLTVTGVALDRIQITPFAPTLPVGFNTPLQATGIYVDNSIQDLTSVATWSSSHPTIASVSNAYGTQGMITPLTGGTVTISAVYAGKTGTNQVEVTSATLSSIDVNPADTSIDIGDTIQYSATGNFSDATTLNITNHVTWLSSYPSIADVSNVQNRKGEAKGLSAGDVTITCIWDTVEGDASLSVE